MAHEPEQRSEGPVLLALDPGRGKCGIAVVRRDLTRVLMQVVGLSSLDSRLVEIGRAYRVEAVILGDRTGSKAAAEIVRRALRDVEIHLVDEHRSTEEGRRRYFAENPPRGWRRLIPRGLLVPPRPYDDYVAVILAARYLRTASGG